MTSKAVEDTHAAELKKLLIESGLECLRAPPESPSLSPVDEEHEEIEELEPEHEPHIEEEHKSASEEELSEEKPAVFPTPSLRRVLPPSFRAALQDNTIHVLPDTFKTNIDPEAIPIILTTPKKVYIDTLAGIVGCTEYHRSLAEFWFLDTLANLLRRAQGDGLDKPTQALLIIWFCEWMKEMQHFDAASRERMLRRFQDNMLAAATFVGEATRIPTPAEVFVHYKALENPPEPSVSPSKIMNVNKSTVSFNNSAYECSLLDLATILHYIYDLFSTDFQYNLIRSIFTFPPDYIHIDYPYQIQYPKRMYKPLQAKKQDKGAKKEKAPPAKVEKSVEKGWKKEKDVDDYEALMELKAQEERELEEQEERDREIWHVRNSILPLYMAVTDALFDKYWPPPPPPSDQEEPEPEPKKKGKKGEKEGKGKLKK